MPFALAIGAGAGLLKSQLVDAPKEERQRKLAAATQRYSPWTGLHAQPIQYADPFGSALQYGATGASMGVGMKNADAQNKWLSSQTPGSQMSQQAMDTQGLDQSGNPWGLYSSPGAPAYNPYSRYNF